MQVLKIFVMAFLSLAVNVSHAQRSQSVIESRNSLLNWRPSNLYQEFLKKMIEKKFNELAGQSRNPMQFRGDADLLKTVSRLSVIIKNEFQINFIKAILASYNPSLVVTSNGLTTEIIGLPQSKIEFIQTITQSLSGNSTAIQEAVLIYLKGIDIKNIQSLRRKFDIYDIERSDIYKRLNGVDVQENMYKTFLEVIYPYIIKNSLNKKLIPAMELVSTFISKPNYKTGIDISDLTRALEIIDSMSKNDLLVITKKLQKSENVTGSFTDFIVDHYKPIISSCASFL